MIDFEQPFVLGIFWASIGLILLALLGAVVILGWRRLAHYDHALELQNREIATSASKIAVLEERARLIDAQRETEQALSVQREANAEDRGANSRFRAQGVAAVAMALENWLRVALATLEQHNIPIVPPPPWFGKHRREHDAYPVIGQAQEDRLQSQINEFIQSVGGQLDWELSPKEPV